MLAVLGPAAGWSPVLRETGSNVDSPLQIAIDGPVASGKTTVARQLAQRLHIDYLDTGAMYRALA